MHVFASFFLLSYCKILYQIVLTTYFITIYNYYLVDGHGSQEHVHVLKVDTSISIDTESARYLVIHSIIYHFTLPFICQFPSMFTAAISCRNISEITVKMHFESIQNNHSRLH